MHAFSPREPLNQAFRDAIGEAVTSFIDSQQPLVQQVGAEALMTQAHMYSGHGKRIRPAFCFWSYVAAADLPDDPAPLLRACASLDLLHVSALVHDDLIDASDTRRGNPAAHIFYRNMYVERHGDQQPERFGDAVSVLLGDLLMMWSAELFDTCGLPLEQVRRALPYLHAMRSEVTCGQYLDVAAAYSMTDASNFDEHLRVAERVLAYKSASYTVRRPCQIGALLAGGNAPLVEALGDFGVALGSAFQLRDDVLGVFGDTEVTGKPAGDDLAEGKRTWLVLHALRDASATDSDTLLGMLGRPLSNAEVERARDIIVTSGALAATEDQISRATNQAREIVTSAPMSAAGKTALLELVELSVRRNR